MQQTEQMARYRKMGPPNFVIIHTDQQRADSIHAYGRREGVYTPYEDSLAMTGARFDACYSACPVCIPQRYSLLTGQSVQKHGIRENYGIPDLEPETTFPAEMGKGGYKTALFGRTMHTYPFDDPYGFQEYLPGDPSNDNKAKDAFFQFVEKEAPPGSGGYYAGGSYNNSRFAGPFHLESRFHQTLWATNRAVEYLQERKKDRAPFMLFLGYYAPHSPHNPPREWMDYYMSQPFSDKRAIASYDIPPVSNGNPISPYVDLQGEELRRLYAGYLGNVSFLDAQVGRVLNELTMLPNTYVIFTSDHGEMLGDHYRIHKCTPYQGAVYTPLIISGPGIAGGRVINAPIGWQDIMPTVLSLAGLPIPESVDGMDFSPLLLGLSEEFPREYLHGEGLVGQIHCSGYERQQREGNWAFENGFQYLTDGKWKYIWYTESGREQLFDLERDYEELHDLSDDPACREELTKWRSRLAACLKDRPEGLSDGKNLHPGTLSPLSPEMHAVCEKRLAQGKKVAYYYARPKNSR